MVRRVCVLVFSAALLLSPAACSKTAERAVEVPRSFPQDVPLLPGANLRMAQEMGAKGTTLIMDASGSVAEIGEFYRERMTEEGWSTITESMSEEHAFRNYKKGERRISLVIARNGDKTSISLTHVDRK